MDQLLYVFSLGFSGSDAVRALVLLLIGALFVGKRILPLRMTLLLLFIDLLWPYAAMLREPQGLEGAKLAIGSQRAHLADAFAGFLVRAAGFYVFIRGTYSLRRKLHAEVPEGGRRLKLLPF